MRTRIVRSLLIAIVVVATSFAPFRQLAATASFQAQTPALTDPMPVDPQITIGKFANGMRYYIRANKKPEKRAELRLVVKAGSILEDDDQQGMAHMVEHMAFNGTKHFPKNEIISFMESLGMRFGADVNAFTSFDETEYMLTVPSDKPEMIDKAFLVLEDWAHNLTFDPTEIEKERGVVMEEWRLGRGAGRRMLDKIFPVILKGSRYADRLPIGKPEIIQNGKAERLKQFYADWYRPDLMAVVAVGDFDKATIENMVSKHFASIPAATKARPRMDYDVPDHAGTTYALATDKENSTSTVEVDTLLPPLPDKNVGDYREKSVENLFSGMLSARLSELSQKPDPPFVFANSGRGSFFARSKDSATLVAIVKEDGIERGLDALLTEAARVSRFGFTATELERQKQNVLRNYERYALEKENIESESRAAEYIRNFLNNESLPTPDDEYTLQKRFLPTINVAEVNKLAKEWFPDNDRLITIRAPEKAGLAIPDQTRLAATVKSVNGKDLKAYTDTVTNAALLDKGPAAPGAVTKTTNRTDVGITEWELSNGVRVILRPTMFKADEILFRATSPGGTSLAPDKDYIPDSAAAGLIAAGGLGKFSVIDLRKLLAGKVASANPFISELSEGLSGGSSRKDLETMFQLIYLRFTEPRADIDAFNIQRAQQRTFLTNQAAIPEFAFFRTLNNARYQDHPRRQFPTLETLDQWNLDKSLAFYKDRFADASDFTFFFVGSFDIASIKPLVEKYLGSLPSIHRKESWKDVGAHAPNEVVIKRVEKGVEPKSLSAIVFSGPFEFDQTHRAAIRAMAEILQRRLLEVIREDLSGTYSINASASYERIPNSTYSIFIQFGSSPTRTEELMKRVFQEIESLKANGPTDQQLADEKEALLREYETNIKLNNYLLGQMVAKYDNREDVAGIWTLPDYYRKLDKTAIQEAAKSYLNTNRYVEVMLFPEK